MNENSDLGENTVEATADNDKRSLNLVDLFKIYCHRMRELRKKNKIRLKVAAGGRIE